MVQESSRRSSVALARTVPNHQMPVNSKTLFLPSSHCLVAEYSAPEYSQEDYSVAGCSEADCWVEDSSVRAHW